MILMKKRQIRRLHESTSVRSDWSLIVYWSLDDALSAVKPVLMPQSNLMQRP